MASRKCKMVREESQRSLGLEMPWENEAGVEYDQWSYYCVSYNDSVDVDSVDVDSVDVDSVDVDSVYLLLYKI